jgi:hypothetical protein
MNNYLAFDLKCALNAYHSTLSSDKNDTEKALFYLQLGAVALF